MNQEMIMNRIAILLSRFSESVRILNANGEFSINVHAENALIQLLNAVFDRDFENVNYAENKHYPAIDLRDKQIKSTQHQRIAIQVTADESLSKVTDCLKKFIKNGMDKDYDALYIVILVKKQRSYSAKSIDAARKDFPFTAEQNILDFSDLYLLLNAKNDLECLNSVREYLEKQFSDGFDYDKHNKYRSDLAEYDASVVRKHEYLDISGYSPRINTFQVKIKMNDLYVTQRIMTCVDSEEYYAPISRLLFPGEKSVILGDPGAGKSTLLKWLMYDICSNRAHYATEIPVYVKCASYAQKMKHEQIDLGAFIIQGLNLKNENVYLEALTKGYLVLMLDGLDEISDVSLRHDVVESINVFIAQHPACRVIATSRKIGYNETRLDAHFTHYELLPFANTQIAEFIRNWFMAVDGEKYNDENVEQFIYRLRRSTSVFELAKTPLLLTIICLIQYQGLSLPEKRIELYSISTNTLLENWVKRRSRYGRNDVSARQLIGLLAPIAFYMQENCDDGIIAEGEFRNQLVATYRKKTRGKDDIAIEQEVDALISYIKEDAGFLREVGVDARGVGQFSFIHLTFQEYFAAIHMASIWQRRRELSNLRDYVLSSQWSEVIVLTAEELYMTGTDPEIGFELATQYVEQVISIDDAFTDRNRPLMLVIKMLGSGIEIDEDLLKRIVQLIIKDRWFTHDFLDRVNDNASREIFLNELINAYLENPEDETICGIMMRTSSEPKVHDALVQCLEGDNIDAKKNMFEFSLVHPVVPITRTDAFRQGITAYVNSSQCASIPTQYTLCYVDEQSGDIVIQIQQAIDAIEDPDKRRLYASDVFREVLWQDRKEQICFLEILKNEYPDVDCSAFERYIAKQQNRETVEKTVRDSELLIDDYNRFCVFFAPERKTLIVAVDSVIREFDRPYQITGLPIPGINDIQTFNMFITLAISFHSGEKTSFDSVEEFNVYSKYFRLLRRNPPCFINGGKALLDYFFSHIPISGEAIRKYRNIFVESYGKLYSADNQSALLSAIINADLTPEEKVLVLARMEIKRKYRTAVHNIVKQYLDDNPPQDWRMGTAVDSIIRRI